MNAAEIATFRALLQDQAATATPRERSWFRLGRRRDDPVLALQTPAPVLAPVASIEPLTLEVVLAEGGATAAAPPPRQPPAFGRRDGEAGLPRLRLRKLEPASADAVEDDYAPAPTWETAVYATPEGLDALDAERAPPPPVAAPAASPGVIAGWSRVRPPSAQRRILARLEAVFLAEQQGLDARRIAAG